MRSVPCPDPDTLRIPNADLRGTINADWEKYNKNIIPKYGYKNYLKKSIGKILNDNEENLPNQCAF